MAKQNTTVKTVDLRSPSLNANFCPLCASGEKPPGGHTCVYCKEPVHNLDECALPAPGSSEGYGQKRICKKCLNLQQTGTCLFPVSSGRMFFETQGFGSEETEHINLDSKYCFDGALGFESREPSPVNLDSKYCFDGALGFESREPSPVNLDSKNYLDGALGFEGREPSPVNLDSKNCLDDALGFESGEPARLYLDSENSSNDALGFESREPSPVNLDSKNSLDDAQVNRKPSENTASESVSKDVFSCNSPPKDSVCELNIHGSDGALVQSPILTVSHKKFRRKQAAASELPQAHNDAHAPFAVFKRNTTNEANCLLCTTKSADFDANCSRCGRGCHRLDTCSVLLPGSDGEHTDKRMCNKCVGLFPSKGVFDLWAFENWGGRGVLNKKEKGYYGRACPELRPRLESNSLSVKLKLLRNGGDSNLQPRKLGGLKISLNNTCAVDSIIHLLMIAYCDSDGFREIADTSNSKILQLAVHLVKKGPNAEAYRLRAEALYENLSDACKPVAFGLMGIDCARTPEELLKKLGLPPSVRDHISCSSQYCPAQGRIQDVSYIAVGYDEIQGNVVNLQDTLDHNKVMDSSVCMQPFKETDGVPLTPDVAIQDQEISKNVLCSGINTHNPVSQDIVFLSVAGQHSLV
ncbi:120.7 kDa protein in NOF-FB transposable element, partial [Frankliniella fusca]